MSEKPEPFPQPTSPTPVDAGSQALAEALRGSFVIVKFVMIVLAIVFLVSGFFTVGTQEKAIILRLGRPVGGTDKALRGSGWHWAWPYPIDEVVKIPITELLTLKSTVGWYAVTPEQEASGTEPPLTGSLTPGYDGYVLAGDGNIVHTRATLRYRIEDPIRCVFGFTTGTNGTYSLAGSSNVVQNALDNALIYSAARFTVDDILTRDVTRFKETVQQRVQDLVQRQQLGIHIEQCDVESRPPRQLQGDFERVTTAAQDRSKLFNEARSYAVQVVSQAGANATTLTNLAETVSTNLIQSITADAVNFQKLRPVFETNRDLFIQQRMLATMARVLTNADDKIYLPTTADGKPVQLRLLLNRELPKAKVPTDR
jgi:modulator of FtsH protease HflK